MLRFAVVVCLITVLVACGEAPMGSSEDGVGAPADAPASASPGADFAGDFALVGTEPFWTGKIRADGLTLTQAGQPEVSAANGGVRVTEDMGIWGVGGLVFRLRAEPCADGMSDRRYGYSAEVVLNGQVLKGCAARR